MDGFTQIRNGLLEHLQHRKLTVLEFAYYVLLHMRANFETGIYTGCALTLAYQAGDPKQANQIRQVLIRLKKKRYINYPRGEGARGGYPILIHKYEPTVGKWSGRRLNAWKHGAECRPEYERVRDEQTVSQGSPTPQQSGSNPNKEIRPKTQNNTGEILLSERSTEDLRIMQRTFTRGGAKCPQSILDELEKRGITLNAGEGVTIHAVAVGSFGKGKIGKVRVTALQNLYTAYARHILRAKVHYQFQRAVRLAWASTNLGRSLPSFSDLSPHESRKLVRIISGERPDMAWPKRRVARIIRATSAR